MKIHYTLFVLTCLLIMIIIPLKAQHTFDSKKRDAISIPSPSPAVNVTQNSKLQPVQTSRQNVLTHNRTFKNIPLRKPHRILSWNENKPRFIETRRDVMASQMTGARKDSRTGCYAYLQEIQSITNIESPEDFVIRNIHVDDQNKSHVRLQQHYKGIPVYGSEIVIHLNEYGEGEVFNGRYAVIGEEIKTAPSVSATQAVNVVQRSITKGTPLRPLTPLEKKLIQHEQPLTTLCLYENESLIKKHVLAYHVVFCPTVHARWEYFIDAQTGNVLHQFNSVCSVDGPKTATANDLNGVSRTINTYQKGATFFLVDISRDMFTPTGSVLPDEPLGGIMTIDLNNTFGNNAAVKHVTSATNTWNANSVSAHFNAGVAYEYYRANHDRDAIDGNNGTIISIINTPDEDGTALDNAFWNGKAMFYGNGKIGFKPLAGSIDVAGHEMTHGVVENTANLEYQGESGAINESMADIFGSMMDPADWQIGEDVVKTAIFPSGALRSLSDPHNGGTSLNDNGFQPKHMNEKFNGQDDNGGVHINSGITNHAFFLYAEEVSRAKAADVFYKALHDYLTKSSQFIDLRLAVIKAAGDLFGNGSNEVTQAGLAFDAVGITSGTGGNFENTLPLNNGTEFLLVYNTNAADANTLYRLGASSENALSTTEFISRPSVTDDGSVAVFVAADKTIHVIITEPGFEGEEFVLDDREIWSNVVISKGGSRLAAVKSDQTKTIHVYDFDTEEWETFDLFNPTYTEGVSSAGPLYADALEWDYSGEFLVYDAFNVIESSDGADIEYWDVNFIHAWDKQANTFGSGEIAKLFSSLPPGVSIGNPAFSKNSPNVLAFDYVDENSGTFYVLGMNIESNEVDIISENNGLGWPSYNKSDTRVAFTSEDGAGGYQTGFVTLNANKISSNGAYTGLFNNTQWPVYFTVGNRNIGDEEVTGIENDPSLVHSCYPNPFVDKIEVKLTKAFTPNNTKIEMTNMMGQRVPGLTIHQSNENTAQINVGSLPPGQYILRVRQGKTFGHSKIVKIR
jgi:bacillolysin